MSALVSACKCGCGQIADGARGLAKVHPAPPDPRTRRAPVTCDVNGCEYALGHWVKVPIGYPLYPSNRIPANAEWAPHCGHQQDEEAALKRGETWRRAPTS